MLDHLHLIERETLCSAECPSMTPLATPRRPFRMGRKEGIHVTGSTRMSVPAFYETCDAGLMGFQALADDAISGRRGPVVRGFVQESQ